MECSDAVEVVATYLKVYIFIARHMRIWRDLYRDEFAVWIRNFQRVGLEKCEEEKHG